MIKNWKQFNENYKPKYKVGDRVMVNPDNDNDNYDDFRDKILIVTHVARNIKEHPGYDESMKGQGLYDLETEDGEEINSSLYDYELVPVKNDKLYQNKNMKYLKYTITEPTSRLRKFGLKPEKIKVGDKINIHNRINGKIGYQAYILDIINDHNKILLHIAYYDDNDEIKYLEHNIFNISKFKPEETINPNNLTKDYFSKNFVYKGIKVYSKFFDGEWYSEVDGQELNFKNYFDLQDKAIKIIDLKK